MGLVKDVSKWGDLCSDCDSTGRLNFQGGQHITNICCILVGFYLPK